MTAAWYPGGACPFVGNPAGTCGGGYFGFDAATLGSSAGYPAAGGRATTLSFDPWLAAAAPAIAPAPAATAAPRPIPGNMNGNPNPPPTSNGTAAEVSIPSGADPISAAGAAAAQPQVGGTDKPPNEAA